MPLAPWREAVYLQRAEEPPLPLLELQTAPFLAWVSWVSWVVWAVAPLQSPSPARPRV